MIYFKRKVSVLPISYVDPYTDYPAKVDWRNIHALAKNRTL